jgi:signal transduction histidine kinase
MGSANGGDGESAVERERRVLRALHGATRDLMGATDERCIASLAVDAASEVLGFAGTGVRLHDADRDCLVSASIGGEASTGLDGRPPFPVDDSPHGEAFRTGETVLHDVAPDSPYGLDAFEHTMYVPLGDHGVLSVGRRTGKFTREEVATAEILGRNVTAALDRAERERRLRERERRLERERARLDEFAGVLSHDLRNPLGVAIGRVELARELATDEVDEHLAAVERAHDRIDERIGEVLTLAREGRVVGEPRPVDLGEAARAAWSAVSDPGDRTTLVGADRLHTVEGDGERLRALFENLFRNGLDHARGEGDPLTVTVGPLAGREGFYVADDGPGIPPEDRETVFHTGMTTCEDGTGFGLAIVRSIAEAHGWTVSVTESETGGARFEVRGASAAEET